MQVSQLSSIIFSRIYPLLRIFYSWRNTRNKIHQKGIITLPSEKNKLRYKELDALRGIAALMVVAYHFAYGDKRLSPFFAFGKSGIDLFFMISGFVIFMSIQKVSSVGEFIINRTSRLYPTYWCCVSLTFLLQLGFNVFKNDIFPIGFVNWVANMTMFQHYFKIPDLDVVYWTLILEMLFYTFIAILYIFNQSKNVITIGLVFVCVMIVLKYWAPFTSYQTTYYLFPVGEYLPLFILGILFYKIATNGSYRLYYVVLLCLVAQAYLIAGSFSYYVEMIGTFFFTCLFILIIHGKLKFLAIRPLLFLGRISFALYLCHIYIGGLSRTVLTKYLHLNYWAAYWIAWVIVLGLATFITFYIGDPGSKKMNRLLRTIFIKNVAFKS